MEEHHRCWRLRYADEVSFHLDTLPAELEFDAFVSVPPDTYNVKIAPTGTQNAVLDADLPMAVDVIADMVTSETGLSRLDARAAAWGADNATPALASIRDRLRKHRARLRTTLR